MGHSRPRYNKAREEQMRLQKQGKRKDPDQHVDTDNAEIIIPKTSQEKEEMNRLKELHISEMEANAPLSLKKKKRLDSYINKKLKQERRVDLFKSLAASQDTLPSSLQLQPSSSLGSKQFKTNQDKLDKVSTLSDRKRSKVLDKVSQKKRGYHSDDSNDSDSNNKMDENEIVQMPEAGPSRLPMKSAQQQSSPPLDVLQVPESSTSVATTSIAPSKQTVVVGSALVRGPDGEFVKPVVRQRQKKAPRIVWDKKVKPHIRNLGLDMAVDGKESDSSFDSSDSEFDTTEDEEGSHAEKMEDGETDSNSEDQSQASGSFTAMGPHYEEEEWEGFGAGSVLDPDEKLSEHISEHPFHNGAETDGCNEGGGVEESDDDEEEEEDDEDDDEDEDGSDSEDMPTEHEGISRRNNGKRKRLGDSFKNWANQQLGISTRTAEGEPLVSPLPAQKKPRIQEGPLRGPLGEDLVIPASSLLQPRQAEQAANGTSRPVRKRTILVERPEEVQEKRLELPILAEEDVIMEAIRAHSVIVICGETGSGKTTQVPQFLYEAGFGSPGTDNPGIIGITQPRRVAAMSMATRVGQELALPPSRVSYQIRYDATTSSTTSIKFMTDGVLLRELANDFLLNGYSVVIVDEAHERSVNTDVLIGTLTRVVKLREELWREGKEGAKPLRMIIMSATLRVTDFTENKTLFKIPPPVVNVGARQHPVTVHFNRKTRPDYMQEAYVKVSKIHARLPPGGILVFLTGQNEIETLCKRLEQRFGQKATKERVNKRARIAQGSKAWQRGKAEETPQADGEASISTANARELDVEPEDVDLSVHTEALAADVDDGIAEEDLEALDSDAEYEDDPEEMLEYREEDSDTPMHILPLYSLLPTDKQMRVFRSPPEGHRLVVISTNVAETSLTIPNIRYVVDCGMAKERTYDQASNIQSFDISWISKAAASQRAGRAGRTGPGHCYRLYSSNVYETQFPQHGTPEILRTPIEGVVLQMKSMNIDQVVNFPFPTPPDRAGLQTAEKVLINLGALTATSVSGKRVTVPARITELGQAMSLFPLSPRFSKMLVTGQQHGCLPYVIAVVSALSVGDPFLRPEAVGISLDADEEDQPDQKEKGQDDFDTLMANGAGAEIAHIRSEDLKAKEMRKLARSAYFRAQLQHAALGKASSDIFKMLSVVGAYEYEGGSAAFCEKNYVRAKAMQEIHKLRAQVTNIVQANYPGLTVQFDPKLLPPSETQLKVIRQLLTAAFVDQVAIRKDLVTPSTPDYAKVSSTRGVPYQAVGVDEDVYIHPSSVVFHGAPPEAVVFQELIRTSRPFIRTITRINTAWLPTLGKPLCTFSRVLETTPMSAAKAAMAGTSASTGVSSHASISGSSAEERDCFVVPKFAGFDNLQLPPVKMTQRRVGSRWVFV